MKKRLQFCVFSLILSIAFYILFLYCFFPNNILHAAVIVTDSMEPILPVYSLVLVEPLSESQEPKAGDIMTFQAEREGKRMLFTHYYDHTEYEHHTTLYYTHAYGKQEIDPFQISKEDIKGIVRFSIPALGKLILYLRSTIGQFTLFIDCLVLIIYEWVSQRFTIDNHVI